MKCPRCQQDHPPHAKFCLECGTPLRDVILTERSYADLQAEIDGLRRELGEAREQQTATAEILRVISSSPTDIQAVLATVAERAARLCDSFDAAIFLVDGDTLRRVAHHGPIPPTGSTTPLVRGFVNGRVVLERREIHLADLQAETDEFAEGSAEAQRVGWRTTLAVPLMRANTVIGTIAIRRTEVRPFSVQQIDLLKTFANQAVIAIENVRLFNETKEALEQQTATSEILRVISQSQTDVQPVFDTIAANARRLCNASSSAVFTFDGELIHLAAQEHMSPQGAAVVRGAFPMPPGRGSTAARAIMTRSIAQITEARDDPEYVLRDATEIVEFRSVLAVPMLRDGHPIGAVSVGKAVTGPFPDKQIALLQTFADQAVIAVENVRLFTELREKNQALTQAHAQVSEALEQQTATAEVLKVISRSTFDLQPVLDTLIENAARLCASQRGVIMRRDGDSYHGVAFYNVSPEFTDFIKRHPITPGRHSITARVALERRTIHVADLQADPEYRYAPRDADPIRTELGVPIFRGDDIVGVIILHKLEVQPFTDKQIELVETFADQAVIAIENVRLFNELEARNRDLTEALQQQTATSEILRVISSSHTDLQPVFDAILHSAGRLCDATFGALQLFDGEHLTLDGHYGISPEDVAMLQAEVFPMRPDMGSSIGRAIIRRATVHIEDIRSDPEFKVSALQTREGYRTALSVPMLRGDIAVGVINLWRRDVRPFSQTHIDMVQTFADQAVIAIENVRLFTELQEKNRALTQAHGQVTEALEQQTATSEILRVIASSPTDVQPVFDTIITSAVRLCDAQEGSIFRFDGQLIHLVASNIADTDFLEIVRSVFPRAPGRGSVTARAILTRAVTHVPDIAADPEYEHTSLVETGRRTVLSVPMLKDGQPIGAITVTRRDVRSFPDKQIALLNTFADQAVIAIENVRLFNELQARTQELSRSVEQLTALGEVGRAVSSTLDLETVLTTIVSRAVQLSGLDGGVVFEYDDSAEEFVQRVATETGEALAEARRTTRIRKGP